MSRYRTIAFNGEVLIEDTKESGEGSMHLMRLTAVCERINLLSEVASKRLQAILDRDHAIDDLRRTMELAVLAFTTMGRPKDVAVFQECLDRTVMKS